MKEWIVAFDVKNTQEEYVECLHVIEVITREREISSKEKEFLQKVQIFSGDVYPEDIIIGKARNTNYTISDIQEEDSVTYLFQVDCPADSDMVNLVYYCLINEKVNQNSSLCIKCTREQRYRGYNIKDMLSGLLAERVIKRGWIYANGRAEEMDSDSGRILKRFSPIFRIDEEEESVTFWRKSMKTFCRELYHEGRIGTKEDTYLDNYFLPHVCPRELREKFPADNWKKDVGSTGKQGKRMYAKGERIIDSMAECFCTRESEESKKSDETKISLIEKRYEYWKSPDFFEMVQDIPVLAMYIFCMFRYFQAGDASDLRDKIEQDIFTARDMADGLLQILENIYHSERRSGYFCFRVHCDSNERSGPYLRSRYKDYIDKVVGDEGISHNYLEIRVADYSRCTISKHFYSDFTKRMQRAEGIEKEIYSSLEKQAESLGVASFFDTSEFWDQYNAISENRVHHYGLQIFESLVSCYGGFFQVRSQSGEQFCPEKDFYSTLSLTDDMTSCAIPGTQYDILLPFREQSRMQNASLNVNIDYTEGLLKKYVLCEGSDFTAEYCNNVFHRVKKQSTLSKLSFQECKERTIRELADDLKREMKKTSSAEGEELKERIVHFPAEKISITMVELFCKVLMLCIAEKPEEEHFYVMITGCTQSHFVEITRMMALFYNKQGENSLMRNTQLFMSGKEAGEEFLIAGATLREAVGSTEKLAFARCTHPYCLKILRKMLKNRNIGSAKPNEIVKIVPFDMIKYDSAGETLLEKRLKDVLEQDVQSEQFGCKLDTLHVRIGSKVHIRTFYEAELLFHNNYYTTRFAYWLLNELCSNSELDLDRPFVLLGNENYSEMLLNELCDLFEKRNIHPEYMIYEERIAGRFRGRRPISKYKDYQFVIIIPINSTLTTHIKISGFLEKAIREALNKEKEKSGDAYKLGRVFNYGIILTSPEKENQYWEKPEDTENTIVSKINKDSMTYYIEVPLEWHHPLDCKACFPEDDYTEEIPLVETNKESVVPMQAIGIKKPEKVVPDKRSEEEDARLEELSRILVFRHVERNGNHYSYYFATEKLWDFPDIRDNIRAWLKRKNSELFQNHECKVYDIIVAPLHYSNTVFVEEVNGCLFSNAALVLHFDVDKEYRMNVRTKYSVIQQLYDNLCEDDEKSIINLHYIDDTIISGKAYQRMKSLFSSLLRIKKDSNVQVNIFKSVVLLVNRMSKSSIRDYMPDEKYFLAYFNLNISSMRVNSDACVLCKKHAEWSKLARQASFNTVYNFWVDKSENIRCLPVEEIDINGELSSDRHERAVRYMLASHNAKRVLDVACESGDSQYVREIMVERLLPESVDREEERDELIAMLKVLGRPFLTFRKEEREAVFKLLLIMLDGLLSMEKPHGTGKVEILLGQIWENVRNRRLVVQILMNRLVELRSNYIIRKRTMNRILEFSACDIETEERKEFVDNYLNRIKQLVGQSNDSSKSLYLEYLLLYDEEYCKECGNKAFRPLMECDESTVFKRNAYLENTELVDYGIEYLAESFSHGMELTEQNLIDTLNTNYYFDNFIQYLVFHKAVKVDEANKVTGFTSDEELKKIEGMVRFELLYQKLITPKNILGFKEKKKSAKEEELKAKFSEMMECLRDAGGAEDSDVIVPIEVLEGCEKYIAFGFGRSAVLQGLERKEQELLEFMRENKDFEKDTYRICDWEDTQCGKQKWVLIKFYDKNTSENSDISVIYLMFPYKTSDEEDILHSMKNILIFRHKIWEILNLSSNILLKNWKDDLFYKQQMLKSRAVSHSGFDDLMRQFNEILEYINGGDYNKKVGLEKKYYDQYFKLLINSMIGFVNAQVLGGRGTEYMETVSRNFIVFWKNERQLIDAVDTVWGLEVIIEDEAKLQDYKIRRGTAANCKKNATPTTDLVEVLFMAVFNNISEHGKKNGNNRCKVSVGVENGWLCIVNPINEEEKNEIEKDITIESYRSGAGISQAVIFDFCKSWYSDVRYDAMFEIRAKESGGGGQEAKKDGNEWLYVVKLPIIERRDDE